MISENTSFGGDVEEKKKKNVPPIKNEEGSQVREKKKS